MLRGPVVGLAALSDIQIFFPGAWHCSRAIKVALTTYGIGSCADMAQRRDAPGSHPRRRSHPCVRLARRLRAQQHYLQLCRGQRLLAACQLRSDDVPLLMGGAALDQRQLERLVMLRHPGVACAQRLLRRGQRGLGRLCGRRQGKPGAGGKDGFAYTSSSITSRLAHGKMEKMTSIYPVTIRTSALTSSPGAFPDASFAEDLGGRHGQGSRDNPKAKRSQGRDFLQYT